MPDGEGQPVLDVGCGVGQVVASLSSRGVDAHAVDVSHPNIERAQQHSKKCEIYDGKILPFDDRFFGVVGAFNVLEHVEEPEDFLKELVRVTQPGGRGGVSSPNFFRVFGFRDYHPKMRGIGNKWVNFNRLMAKRRILHGLHIDVGRSVLQILNDLLTSEAGKPPERIIPIARGV